MLIAETNFLFMFSPNEKSEVLIQRGSNLGLFELVMREGRPRVNFIWKMDNVPDLEGTIHSGVRFKDPRYMFVVDDKNFYKIDI